MKALSLWRLGGLRLTTPVNNNDLARSLYLDLLKGLPRRRELPRLILVQHAVQNTVPMFQALADRFDIAAIIPKPRSIHSYTMHLLNSESKRYPVRRCTREDLAGVETGEYEPDFGEDDGRPVVILDIGGYFVDCAPALHRTWKGGILGIVEDTENGHQRYERMLAETPDHPFPIYSVARSPLKEPEDFLVGQSILYAVESVIRDNYSLLINRQVLVIGYGKIGRSIANSLAVRNVPVWVYDACPIKQAQALSHGFVVPERKFALQNAGLIFGATGNKSLRDEDFDLVRQYAFIASVTSADDEFELEDVFKRYSRIVDGRLTTLESKGRIFHLINDGNAVNFIHNNALGVYIYLVASEILFTLKKLIMEPQPETRGSVISLSKEERQVIAGKWKDRFFSHTLLGRA